MPLTLHQKIHRFFNEMDFVSQQKAQTFIRTTIVLVAIISYLIGYHFQKFSYCVYSILVAIAVVSIITVPGGLPWWRQPSRVWAKSKSKIQ